MRSSDQESLRINIVKRKLISGSEKRSPPARDQQEISKSQPHAAYVAFTKGFRSKFTYYGAADKGQGSQLVAERYSNRRTQSAFQQAEV